MKTAARGIRKGDRVRMRFGRKPRGMVVGTAWGDVVNRNGRKIGRELWVRVRWEDCNYGGLNPHDAVIARDVQLPAPAKGERR
ncbi:MAG: hypothetical protein HY748_16455 [Elusimicrobia bacterium]|nr:hypothetical protein [Elusimicrobiota bacterium]